jgi:hypothetical protein
MTDEQIVIQLERLSTIGKIEVERIPEYCRSLRNYSHDDLKQACTEIIDTWVERRFPRPSDIRDQIGKIIVRRQEYNPDRSGNQKTTSAFLDTLNLIWTLADKKDYCRLHAKMMKVNTKHGDKLRTEDQYVEEMKAIQKEAAKLPKRVDEPL